MALLPATKVRPTKATLLWRKRKFARPPLWTVAVVIVVGVTYMVIQYRSIPVVVTDEKIAPPAVRPDRSPALALEAGVTLAQVAVKKLQTTLRGDGVYLENVPA